MYHSGGEEIQYKIVLILMPDYLFNSQFESMLSVFSFESEKKKKKKKTIPAPEDQRVDPVAILYVVNCTVCQDIEKVACEYSSRHDPETNQHTHLCHKIHTFVPQDWTLEWKL